jgi:hypothetical protein
MERSRAIEGASAPFQAALVSDGYNGSSFLVAVGMSGASRESALIGRTCHFTHPADGTSAR